MEKLMELLYKYQKLECFYPLYYDVEENKIYFDSDGRAEIWAEQYLISKDFWFIKRLVDNDKIDERKIPMEDFYPERREEYVLLMLLAISDTPIEDLISYLN